MAGYRLMDDAAPVIATAGWSIPSFLRARFDIGSSLLTTYATRLRGVEMNSSFYRPHRADTWARWAASVPDGFRFAVKCPRAMTHHRRLIGCEDDIARFAGEIAGLGDRQGPLLVQLPPSLAFDADVAARFFAALRRAVDAPVAVEPRHASWFEDDAEQMLEREGLARVAADPARCPGAELPGGDRALTYIRLHGSPRIYRSAYDEAALAMWQDRLGTAGDRWLVFDNTAEGAATKNALDAAARLGALRGSDDARIANPSS